MGTEAVTNPPATKPVEQRVPITWTESHFGGRRPWFTCSAHVNGRYCGRRVAMLYLAGEFFACRKCYGLAYASQRGGLWFGNLRKSQRIRMRLGGSPDHLNRFPRSRAACISERICDFARRLRPPKLLHLFAASVVPPPREGCPI
jgi:hypothetical protein